MPRHTPRYPTHHSWQAANVIATAGGFLLGLGLLAFLAAAVALIPRRRAVTSGGEPPGDADPWQGHTLEWTTASPPPPHNFDVLPEVRSERPLLDLLDVGTGG